jgi:predicted RNase H-like HicB family nuclease
MKFRVVLEYDPEAESWSAVCPELPGCTSAGLTEEQARKGIAEAIKLYLAPRAVAGSPQSVGPVRPWQPPRQKTPFAGSARTQ